MVDDGLHAGGRPCGVLRCPTLRPCLNMSLERHASVGDINTDGLRLDFGISLECLFDTALYVTG